MKDKSITKRRAKDNETKKNENVAEKGNEKDDDQLGR